jgi:hypothetical protein
MQVSHDDLMERTVQNSFDLMHVVAIVIVVALTVMVGLQYYSIIRMAGALVFSAALILFVLRVVYGVTVGRGAPGASAASTAMMGWLFFSYAGMCLVALLTAHLFGLTG